MKARRAALTIWTHMVSAVSRTVMLTASVSALAAMWGA